MKNDVNVWISRIGLGIIFCYCLLASIFFSYFAQLHLTLCYLPFPVFVGEIVICFCLPLLVWVNQEKPSFSHRTLLLIGLYFGWVLIKAFINYHFDGPLTCRNAALFYYPVYAVFAYSFYQKAMMPREVLIALAFLAGGILFFKVMNVWYWWSYVTIFVIAIRNVRSYQWRWVGWVFLAVIFGLGKEYLYQGHRGHFVSIFGVVLFLGIYVGCLFAKRHDYVRLSIVLVSFIIFTLGYRVFSEHNTVISVISLTGMVDTYNKYDKYYKESLGNFTPEKLTVHLYNPKKLKTLFLPPPVTSVSPVPTAPSTASSQILPDLLENIQRNRMWAGRSLDLDENNIVFRLFVWRDMIHELIAQRAWWGFSFGHPQRSKSLETLHWGESEWGRDGWITPHNSFLHIIYRAGILGLFFIAILFYMVGKLIKDFLRLDSMEGGFLVSALIYWMVLSNFFIILEFPYNAIIFWTTFGITCAYRDDLRRQEPWRQRPKE